MTEKSYMLSMTYACPDIEFDDPKGFYDGMSLDQANLAIHKIFQFCGLSPLESYAIYNVHKDDNLNMEKEIEIFLSTLQRNFPVKSNVTKLSERKQA